MRIGKAPAKSENQKASPSSTQQHFEENSLGETPRPRRALKAFRKQMRVLCFSILLATALAYERINVFSDQESIASIGRDSDRDVITVRSTTGLGISFKGYSNTNITHPEGLEEFRVTITTPSYNMGRYRLTVPFEGLHVTMKYDHQRPLTGLCDIFASLLPCFRVKQCSSSCIVSLFISCVVEESVYDIDLDDAIWTPTSLVPYSVLKPTSIGRGAERM